MATANPTDPNVTLPRQAKDLIAQGRRDFDQQGQQPAPQGDPPPAPDPKPDPTPPTPDPDLPSDDQLGVNPDGVRPPVDDWQQRYRTLQGKYDAETRRMREQVAQLQGAVDALSRRAPEAPPEPKAKKRRITEQDETFLGKDVLEVVERKVRDIVEDEIEDLKRQNDELRQRLTGTESAARSASHMTLAQRLDGSLPGWQTQNNDPMFLAWLRDEDEMTGIPRQAILQKAQGDGNADRIVKVFRAFRQETGVDYGARGGPPAGDTQQRPVAAPPPKARVPLQNLVTPGRGRGPSGGPAQDQDTRQLSQGEIDAHYAERQRYMRNGVPIPAEVLAREPAVAAAVRRMSGVIDPA